MVIYKLCRSLCLAGVAFALVAIFVAPGPAQAQQEGVTVQVRPMLKITVVIKPGGAEVQSVQAGPATNMARADNPKIRGLMEPDDIITKVGGRPVKTLDDLRDSLAAGGQVIITGCSRPGIENYAAKARLGVRRAF